MEENKETLTENEKKESIESSIESLNSIKEKKPLSFREKVKEFLSGSFFLKIILFIFDINWLYFQKKKVIDSKVTNKFPVQIEWKDIEFSVPVKAGLFKTVKKQILHPMSGYVASGQVLAIMGPSGAGNYK
jgi:ABC-type multidrug transport system fused ATPase/permease subunit